MPSPVPSKMTDEEFLQITENPAREGETELNFSGNELTAISSEIDRLNRLPIQLLQRFSQSQIRNFCRRWKVKELALFGSILREDFRPDSDVDVLISFDLDADWSLLDHVKMQQELGNIFSRKVDLVSKRAIVRSQNWIRRREILETAKIIYVK